MNGIVTTLIGSVPVILLVGAHFVRTEHRLTRVETNIEWIIKRLNGEEEQERWDHTQKPS